MKHFSLMLTSVLILFLPRLSAQPEFGMASYYSDKYQGSRTAYGEEYDKDKLTCSHKKHPYGTLLKVTRLDNKKSVVVRVNDKGPYTKGRIVDLSRAAAEKLDLINDGVARVKVEIYKNENSNDVQASAAPPPTRVPPVPTAPSDDNSPPPAPKPEPPAAGTEVTTAPAREAETTPSAAQPDRSGLVGQDYTKYGLYKIRLERTPQAGYGVQVAVITQYENVLRAIADYQAKNFDAILISVEPGGENQKPLYKVILGTFDSEAAAKNYQADLKKRYNINGFVVNFAEKNYGTP